MLEGIQRTATCGYLVLRRTYYCHSNEKKNDRNQLRFLDTYKEGYKKCL